MPEALRRCRLAVVVLNHKIPPVSVELRLVLRHSCRPPDTAEEI